MPFPGSDRVIFRKNPLDEVICQLRFPTILEIGTQDPAAFQKRIRHKYPIFEKEDPASEFRKSLPPDVAGLVEKLQVPLVPQRSNPTYRFKTEDEKRFISLATDFVAVSEKRYERWESFAAEIEQAKDSFEREYDPSFYTRIGLRYRDVIDKEILEVEQPWSSLINPALIGALGARELQEDIEDVRTAALIRIPGVKGGYVRLVHGLAKRGGTQKAVYLIDSDFYTQERCGRDDVARILDTFRTAAGNLFRWAATERLRHLLEPIPID